MTAFGRKQGAAAPPISQELWRDLFGSLPEVLEYNSQLCEQIKKRVITWNFQQKIGDIFVEASSKLTKHTTYVNNYNKALAALHQCQKISAFVQTCQEIYSTSKVRLTISDLLIIPIQRIPRYVLLLEQLLKKTRKDHPDKATLEEAVVRLKETAADINKKKGESMKLQAVIDLQQKLTNYPAQKLGDLATVDRRIIREGTLFERMPTGNYKERYVFLFHDLLMCTKPIYQQGFFNKGVNMYEFKWAFPLSTYGSDAIAPPEEIQSRSDSKDIPNNLYPMIFNWQTDSKGEKLEKKVLACPTFEEKNEWEADFKREKDSEMLKTASGTLSSSSSMQSISSVTHEPKQRRISGTFFRPRLPSNAPNPIFANNAQGGPNADPNANPNERPRTLYLSIDKTKRYSMIPTPTDNHS